MTLTSRKARNAGFPNLLLAFPAQPGEVAFMQWILIRGSQTAIAATPTS